VQKKLVMASPHPPIHITRHEAGSEPRVLGEDVRGSDDEALTRVLGEVVTALESGRIPYVLIGGLASSGYGRPRWTHDIDIMVKPEHADSALAELAAHDFVTEKLDPRWIYKAFKHEVMVDIIFRSRGGIYLDDAMLARAVSRPLCGHTARFISPEDLLVMKAVAHDEGGPRHWHDALAVVASSNLDWDYLVSRAARAPRRVLSLLLYAHSLDLLVPNRAITALFHQIYEE
jgi:hypothetical protein